MIFKSFDFVVPEEDYSRNNSCALNLAPPILWFKAVSSCHSHLNNISTHISDQHINLIINPIDYAHISDFDSKIMHVTGVISPYDEPRGSFFMQSSMKIIYK